MKIGIVKRTPTGTPTARTELNFETGKHERVEGIHPDEEFPYRIYVYGAGMLYFESSSGFASEEEAKTAAAKFLEDVQKTLAGI